MGPAFSAKQRLVSRTARPWPLPSQAWLLCLAASGRSSGLTPGENAGRGGKQGRGSELSLSAPWEPEKGPWRGINPSEQAPQARGGTPGSVHSMAGCREDCSISAENRVDSLGGPLGPCSPFSCCEHPQSCSEFREPGLSLRFHPHPPSWFSSCTTEQDSRLEGIYLFSMTICLYILLISFSTGPLSSGARCGGRRLRECVLIP